MTISVSKTGSSLEKVIDRQYTNNFPVTVIKYKKKSQWTERLRFALHKKIITQETTYQVSLPIER